MNDKCKLPPEVEEGNKEYKRKLCSLSRYRFQQLQSQMKWRINEGNGVAIYYIGVDDDGSIVKLNTKDKKESLKNVKKIASQINAYVESIEYKNYYEVIIKEKIKIIDFSEKRIVFLGNSDVGKSTLISVLCGNEYDNGKGSARLSLFNHKHEMFTGITSSISIQTYDSKNKKKIVLIDLPGRLKYKKTKYYGLLSYDPELAVIVIDYKTTLKSIENIYLTLKFFNIPIQFVKTKSDLDNSIKKLKFDEMKDLISVSALNGSNLEKLRENLLLDNNSFNLNKYPNSTKELSKQLLDDTVIFQISEVYYLLDLGLIVSGILLSGELETNQKIKLGPIKINNNIIYHDVIVTSIHCYQTPYNKLHQDHIGTIVIKFKDNKINLKSIYNKISKNTYLSNHNLNLSTKLNAKIKILSDNVIKDCIMLNLFIRNILIEGEIKSIKPCDESEFDITCEIILAKPAFIKKYDKFIFDTNTYKGFGLLY